MLVYNKKDADPHLEINGTDVCKCEITMYLRNVCTCEITMYLRNVISTTNKYEMVFDGIKNVTVVLIFVCLSLVHFILSAKTNCSSVLLCTVQISTMASVA